MLYVFFCFKQKTAYEMRISDWSSGVCSSDLLAGDADREAGAGKRMAADEHIGQPQFAAEFADFVLEQFAQGLDELHVHPLGQAADIVVALDRHRWAAGEADAFDHVGIERALREKFGAAAQIGKAHF